MRTVIRELRARLESGGKDEESGLRRRLEKLATQKSSPPESTIRALHPEGLADFLEGQWKQRPSGRVLAVTREFPERHRHGNHLLAELDSLPPELLCLLANNGKFRTFRADKVLFMDTETTGLAGGAGTYVFLVGIGFFEQQAFRIQQFFLPTPQSEQAFLEELTETIQQGGEAKPFHHLVSFNGKATT